MIGPTDVPLLERWHSASIGSVWLRPSDWYTPAAEALAEALEARLDTAPAAFRLGQARSDAGVGIAEALDDLAVLFTAAGWEAVPPRTMRALCEGWTASGTQLGVPGSTDAESGLGTGEYLTMRLAEVYGEAARAGESVTRTWALVMTDVSISDPDPWQRIARNAAMGEALEAAYGAGHPMARLNDGLYAVLVRRDEDLGPSLARLRGHIGLAASTLHVATLLRQPPRMWVESLPGTHAYAQELIESLVR